MTLQTVALGTGPDTSGADNLYAGFVKVNANFTELYGVGVVLTSGASISLSASQRIVIVNKSVGSATAVTLPSSPTTFLSYTVKDGKGDAATNNITVTPVSGQIDGGSSFVINIGYESASFIFDGTNWSVI